MLTISKKITNDITPLRAVFDLVERLLGLFPDLVVRDTIESSAIAPLNVTRYIT